MTTIDTVNKKLDLLIGVLQDLAEKVNGYAGVKPPVHKWVSSAELAVLLGYSQRTILDMVHQNKFKEEWVQKKKRGKYNIYRFDAELILPFAYKYWGKSTR